MSAAAMSEQNTCRDCPWRVSLCLMNTHYHAVLAGARVNLSTALHRLNGRYAAKSNVGSIEPAAASTSVANDVRGREEAGNGERGVSPAKSRPSPRRAPAP
jgi:hypothetical protein